MHEFHLCRSLLDHITRLAEYQHAARVTAIEVEIGPLAGISAEELRHSFPHASHGTLAQDAELRISQPPLRLCCLACGYESQGNSPETQCPVCHDTRLELAGSNEMVITHLEFGN